MTFLTKIMTEAQIDARIDKDVLALEILQECGAQTPRYMDSSFFAVMATNYFKIKSREITRDLNALEVEYDPFDEFNVERHGGETAQDIYGKTNTRTDNLQRKFAQGAITAQHSVSADNEDGLQLRDQDHTSTEDDYTNDTGTQTHVDSGTDTHTKTYNEREHGHHKAAQELLSSEFEANKLNIYHMIALDFSDAMMIAVC